MSLDALVTFTNDAAGLEKTLRLLQAFCTVAIGLLGGSSPDIDWWMKARGQFNLGRRYFRLLKWHPCWTSALKSLADQGQQDVIRRSVEVTKWSLLGLYFFLEMFTITYAMGLTNYDWGPAVQREANKCWFYSLSTSILLSLYGLLLPTQSSTSPRSSSAKPTASAVDEAVNGTPEKRASTAPASKISRSSPDTRLETYYTQLVIDCCDLLIPGSAVGWISVDQVIIGLAMMISTFLAGQQIWKRVQRI